jgi:hypothetical protein
VNAQGVLDAVALLLVAVSVAAQLLDLPDELHSAAVPAQYVVLGAGLLYLVAGTALLAGWRRRARWLRASALAWASGTLLSAAVASREFGGAPWTAVLASGVVVLLLGGFIIRRVARRMAVPTST